jgi:hypothetical protein
MADSSGSVGPTPSHQAAPVRVPAAAPVLGAGAERGISLRPDQLAIRQLSRSAGNRAVAGLASLPRHPLERLVPGLSVGSTLSQPTDLRERSVDRSAELLTAEMKRDPAQTSGVKAAPPHATIHSDPQAAEAAAALHARAFTIGNDIYFGAGEFQPDHPEGLQLLVHELLHTVEKPAAGRIMRKKGRQAAEEGQKTFTVTVKWKGDAGDFFSAVVTAIARKTGIPEAALFQPCHAPAYHVYSQVEVEAGSHHKKSVRVDVSLGYNPDVFPSVNGLTLSPAAEKPASRPGAEKPRPEEKPAVETIPPNETPEQRLNRQAKTTVRVLSQFVSDADREGYASIVITMDVDHSKGAIGWDLEKREPKTAQRSGTTYVSAATVAREHMKPQVEAALIGEKGRYRIEFVRTAEGRFEFARAQRIEKPPPAGPGKTEREMLDEMGIPDRKKIYADIFKKTEAELKDVGIKIAGFTLEQVALWIAGGLLLRVVGLLGAGVARAFPRLLRALELGESARIARALARLSEAEAGEWAILMKKGEQGVLSGAEKSRLSELLLKLESALGGEAGQAGRGGAAIAGAEFNAARVAEELVASTTSLAHGGQKMLAAARELSALEGLSAAQKAEAMLQFLDRIGFAIGKQGVVDEGARLVMYAEDSRYALAFIKDSGKILYGKFDMQAMEYIWNVIK